jgi:hypothetical protein
VTLLALVLLFVLVGCGQQSTSDCQYVEQQQGNFMIWDTHCDQYRGQ